MPTTEELNGGFDLGEWEVLPAQGLMRRGDEEVHPEPKVFAVLLALAERDGNLVTKDELIEEVWDGKAFSDEPILRCISLLRGHFGDKKPFQYVETLQRRGYRLLKPVELHEPVDRLLEEPAHDDKVSLRLWKTVAAVVAIGFVAVAALNWIPPAEPAVRSLAILPVDNLSGDATKQYIADGIKTSLAHQLSELSAFTVKIAREEHGGEPAEIARALNVESVLEASLQMQGDTLKVTWLITRGDDNEVLGSGEETGELRGVFGLEERLAKAVRDELAGRRTPELITRAAPDSKAYDGYLRGMHALEDRFRGDNLEESIELFIESIARDESYGPAYLGLATAYALLPDYRGADLATHYELAIETIEKGVSMDSSIEAPGGAIYGFVYHQRKQWVEAQANYERAVNAPVVDSNAFNWYSMMLASVGRLEDARNIAVRGGNIYPDSTIINSRVAMAYTWLGNTAEAFKYFDRANDLDATGILHDTAFALLLVRGGQAELSRDMAFAAVTAAEGSTDWIDAFYDAIADPAKARNGLAAIDLAWAEQRIAPHIVLVARTLLGDIAGAMEIARLQEQRSDMFSMEIYFIPEMAPLRQHDDFIPLLERLNVVDYWNDERCTWEDDRVTCEN